jgi:hypothetical protein
LSVINVSSPSPLTRVSAPNCWQPWSPKEVTPTTTGTLLRQKNDGPPESPLHLPLPSV